MSEETSGPTGSETDLHEAEEALRAARAQLLETPAEVVVTNHAMGLYELAAIHLSADPPDLVSATLAIDAMAALVETLGDRLGDDAQTMRDALANIRLAFVQIKRQTGQSTPGDDEPTRGPATSDQATGEPTHEQATSDQTTAERAASGESADGESS